MGQQWHIPYFALPYRRYITDDKQSLTELGMECAKSLMEEIYVRFHDPGTGKFKDYRSMIFAERDRLVCEFQEEHRERLDELKARKEILTKQYKNDQKVQEERIKAIDKKLAPLQSMQREYKKANGKKNEKLERQIKPLRSRREVALKEYKDKQKPFQLEQRGITRELSNLDKARDEYLLSGVKKYIKEQFGVDDSLGRGEPGEPFRKHTFVHWMEIIFY